MRPKYSIVAPVYNEEESLAQFYKRISSVMKPSRDPWELVIVDDGSNDRSAEIIRDLAKKDKKIRPVIFARNFGHQIAVTAGLDYCRGEAAIIIDADLQDPPEVILELIEKWKEGYQVVYAVRQAREGESWFKKATASFFYRLISRITDIKIPLDSGDFRLLDRKVIDVMGKMRERHRFLRGMSTWVGFRQIGVEYDREARFAGETKYPLKKMVILALNAMTSFSYFPLQLATITGFIIALLSMLAIIVVIILRLTNTETLLGQATTLVVVLFMGGIQLIFLGILGEYIGRIYDEAKGRPLYVVSETPDDYVSNEVHKSKHSAKQEKFNVQD